MDKSSSVALGNGFLDLGLEAMNRTRWREGTRSRTWVTFRVAGDMLIRVNGVREKNTIGWAKVASAPFWRCGKGSTIIEKREREELEGQVEIKSNVESKYEPLRNW